MKHHLLKVIFSILTLLILTPASKGQSQKLISNVNFKTKFVSIDEATGIAANRIARCGMLDIFVKSTNLITKDSEPIAWVFDLAPQGYVVVSTSAILPEVIAYSFESNFGQSSSTNPLFELLVTDISSRLKLYSEKGLIANNSFAYEKSRNPVISSQKLYEQWPPTGDGWLQSNWTQEFPYNDMCPMDPVTQSRSYAGCPSVAMAQILDFHKNTNNTHFDDSDDYYHNYAGRQYSIDDDYQQIGFASFPQLNDYLDTLNQHWIQNMPLTNTDKAALTFACGVACTQVYTSEGSGTFSVDQAYDAYKRFGFSTSELLHESDTTLWDRLAQNIKDTLPAHLAVVDEAWQSGHNVVVDGYNSDDYYHINFGWGGTFNGWYLLPEEMPYGLTVVEGIILDIMKDTTVKTINYPLISCKVFPNPSSDFTTITFPNQDNENHSVLIYSSTGQLIETINVKGNEATLKTSSLKPGMYYFTLQCSTGLISTGKILVN